MIKFTSTREKRLWTWSLLVSFTIFLSLFLGRPLQHALRDQNVQAVLFVLGMLLVGVTILIHGLSRNARKFELVILIGILSVYVMFFLRLGAPERSHLIEYSILAVFVYSALVERAKPLDRGKFHHAIGAFTLTFLIGILDESLQLFIPHRVFDPQDIFFNGIASFMAIGACLLLQWVRNR